MQSNGILTALVAAILLSACLSGPAPRPDVAVYDLGTVETVARNAGVPLTVEVIAPSWLDGNAMQYRMQEDPARRQQFSESRWAAPPAELLAAALRRQLGAQAGTGAEGCRLRIDLDEWVQVFDRTGQSRMHLAVRAGLRSARSGELIEQRGFSFDRTAGGNARQGVAAAATLETQLAQGLDEWLRGLAQKHRDMVGKCRN